VTLDLNGYTLTKDGAGGQIIVNGASEGKGGTLNIVDGGATKGKIVCSNNTTGVCVKTYSGNTGTVIDGVTIESVHAAVKTDETGEQIIKNSTLISSGSAGAIQNWGSTIVENSSIINSSGDPGVGGAIDMRAYGSYVSSIVIKDSEIIVAPGGRVFYAECYAPGTCTGVSGNAGSSIDIVIDEGTTIPADSTVQLIDDTDDISLQIKNSVIAPINFLQYAQPGATITLNGDIADGEYMVSDVTLVIPEDVAIGAGVKFELLGTGAVALSGENRALATDENGLVSVVQVEKEGDDEEETNGEKKEEESDVNSPKSGTFGADGSSVASSMITMVASGAIVAIALLMAGAFRQKDEQ
jgi:hypothetical protein